MAPSVGARAWLAGACAAGLFAGAAAMPEYPSFEEYLEARGLAYAGPERARREQLYAARLQQIRAQNAKEGGLWQAAVNDLTLMTQGELEQQLMGYTRTSSLKSSAPLLRSSSRTLPISKDWRDVVPSVVTPVKNQGDCGSCWAHAAAAALESAIAIASGQLFEASRQKLTSCTPNPLHCGGDGGCMGATAQLAFNYTVGAGVSRESSWSYISGRTGEDAECNASAEDRKALAGITGYRQLPANDAEALLQAVQVNPVTLSVAASGWSQYSKGIFDGCDPQRPIVNHVVVLNGYGVEGGVAYWLVRNSWGPHWGEGGYIRIQRFPEGEPWGVDTQPLQGSGCRSSAPASIPVRGMCGILSDSAYPTGAFWGAEPH